MVSALAQAVKLPVYIFVKIGGLLRITIRVIARNQAVILITGAIIPNIIL